MACVWVVHQNVLHAQARAALVACTPLCPPVWVCRSNHRTLAPRPSASAAIMGLPVGATASRPRHIVTGKEVIALCALHAFRNTTHRFPALPSHARPRRPRCRQSAGQRYKLTLRGNAARSDPLRQSSALSVPCRGTRRSMWLHSTFFRRTAKTMR